MLEAEEAEHRDIKAGELVVLTSGSYSSYQMVVACRATADFNPDAMLREWWELQGTAIGEPIYQPDPDAFCAWLVTTKNVLEEVPAVELHADQDYSGTFSRDIEAAPPAIRVTEPSPPDHDRDIDPSDYAPFKPIEWEKP